ncbi:MAG: patatin, partial [Acidobacteria bacterium]|nr:patatin [Acidobacteriota bacterium]
MFFRNIFSFQGRHDVCEHAYRNTRAELLARYDELAPVLARHGITLRKDLLEEPGRNLWQHIGLPRSTTKSSPAVLRDLDSLLSRLEEAVGA